MIKLRTLGASRGAWLGAFAALMALPAMLLSAPAFAGNIKVVMSVELKASPADVWKTIGAFDKLQDWHPAVASTSMQGSPTQVGTIRVLHLNGGGDIKEELTSYSDKDTTLTYRILESPLPVANYESYLYVTDAGKGHSLVVWGSTFDAAGGADDKKAKSVIMGVYKAGFDTLAKKFGRAGGMKAMHKAKPAMKKMEEKPAEAPAAQ
jgi:hypothetical protein